MDRKKKCEITKQTAPLALLFDDFCKRLVCPDDDEPVIKGRWFGDGKLYYHDNSTTLNWKRKNNDLNEIVKMKTV
jgi:hypothetical protein